MRNTIQERQQKGIISICLKAYIYNTGVSVAMAITCPDDYIHFHESCYHFGHRSSDFTEAEVRRVII